MYNTDVIMWSERIKTRVHSLDHGQYRVSFSVCCIYCAVSEFPCAV